MAGREGAPKSRPVLVVEDDADIRNAMAELFQGEGFDCIVAEHGLDALVALGLESLDR
jgi:CheY-like chemotaxis protein